MEPPGLNLVCMLLSVSQAEQTAIPGKYITLHTRLGERVGVGSVKSTNVPWWGLACGCHSVGVQDPLMVREQVQLCVSKTGRSSGMWESMRGGDQMAPQQEAFLYPLSNE